MNNTIYMSNAYITALSNDKKTLHIMKSVLRSNGIPMQYYSIGKYAEECICMERAREGWEVYSGERGNKYDLATYESAFIACKQVLNRVAESDEQCEKMINEFSGLYHAIVTQSKKKATKRNDRVSSRVHVEKLRLALKAGHPIATAKRGRVANTRNETVDHDFRREKM